MANIFYLIARKLHQHTRNFLEVPVDGEREFLAQLPEPQNDYERSYLQYRCQNYYKNGCMVFVLNLVAFFIQPFVVFALWMKGIFVKQREVAFDALSDLDSFQEVLPEELKETYALDFKHWFPSCSLSSDDIPLLWDLWRKYPFSAFFTQKCVLKLAYYSNMIRTFRPKAVVTHNEFAFTSSVTTLYCERMGVKHINVMHGEKLYYIRDSFFRFSKTYIWNEYYRQLFVSLRAAPTQFVVSVPLSMRIESGKYASEKDYADFKYYLQIYTSEQISSIVSTMNSLKAQGYSVKYRPHPRYSDIAALEKLVSKDEIEYPREVSILTSVDNMKYAVGSFTTVLNQAYASGKKVVLDDVTYREQYIATKQRDYIFSAQGMDSIPLSTLINNHDENI